MIWDMSPFPGYIFLQQKSTIISSLLDWVRHKGENLLNSVRFPLDGGKPCKKEEALYPIARVSSITG
jgi:hypothetical protein